VIFGCSSCFAYASAAWVSTLSMKTAQLLAFAALPDGCAALDAAFQVRAAALEHRRGSASGGAGCVSIRLWCGRC
jgi:hypothetical protein